MNKDALERIASIVKEDRRIATKAMEGKLDKTLEEKIGKSWPMISLRLCRHCEDLIAAIQNCTNT